MDKEEILRQEESFHDQWAKTIDIDDLLVYEAFKGSVTPEYYFSVKLLGDINEKKILNPGCGGGEEAVFLAQKGAKVTAIDISSGMLSVTQKMAKKFGLSDLIDARKMNASELSFPDESFDLIYGNSVLHHIDIERSVQEFWRVLVPSGKAVFIEPLSYNPVINYYRKLANTVRTPNEHPMTFEDINLFSRRFSKVRHYEFQLLTLIIFCSFFLFERVHPNQDSYWKKIIRESQKYKSVFGILYSIDRVILKLIPALKKYCWVTVIEAVK